MRPAHILRISLLLAIALGILLPSAVGGMAVAGGRQLSVDTYIDNSSYSWFGNARVKAYVTYGGSPVTDCDSVVVTSAANPMVRDHLADDGVYPDSLADDGWYTGYFRIGGELGEARPTGYYSITATAHRDADVGSDTSPTFSLYSVRRWTGITTSSVDDIYDEYTNFIVDPVGEGEWHHTIENLGLIRSSAVNDALIRVPILPLSNTVSNVWVFGSGVSDVSVQGNVIQFICDLTSSSVARVAIEFDAPSDLAATYIDRYNTGDMAHRDFQNGYEVWNRYIHTGVIGSGYSSPHGPGCVVDLQVTDLMTGDAHTVDCMERVAVHLDDTAYNDGTGTYPSNIKWVGESPQWLKQCDLGSIVFQMESGGLYGLKDKVSVTKTVQFYPDRRYFRHHCVTRNVDFSSHDFDFVWGREQWLYGSAPGSDRSEDDRGLLPNDPGTYGGEHGFPGETLDGNWFAAYDQTSFYSIGVILPDATPEWMPTYAYFLCQPALGGGTGEYPIIPSGSCSNMGNIFFEKQFGVLAPGDSAVYAFYQWGGYGVDRDGLTDLIWQDASEISGQPMVVAYAPEGTDIPLDTPIDVWFNKAMDREMSQSALLITPQPGAGTWQWSEGDRHMRFQPGAPLEPDTTYQVRVLATATDVDGRPLANLIYWTFTTASDLADLLVADGSSTHPDILSIQTATPNPFSRKTIIEYGVPQAVHARLAVYNVGGQLVRVLLDGPVSGGRHRLLWEGDSESGGPVAPGVYFCRLESGLESSTRKLVIQR